MPPRKVQNTMMMMMATRALLHFHKDKVTRRKTSKIAKLTWPTDIMRIASTT